MKRHTQMLTLRDRERVPILTSRHPYHRLVDDVLACVICSREFWEHQDRLGGQKESGGRVS